MYAFYAVVGDGAQTILAYSAARACAKAGDGRIDRPLWFGRDALGDSDVLADEAARVQLGGE